MLARKRFIISIFIMVFISGAAAFALAYTSPGYTLQNARVVISGGRAASENYSLVKVRVGNIFGGKSQSLNYSIDASRTDRREPPAPPRLNPIKSPTNVPVQALSGQKDIATSIYINGYEVVSLNSEAIWSGNVSLAEGDNHIFITARDTLGLESDPVSVNIILDTVPPLIVITSPQANLIVYGNQISVESLIDGVPFIEERSLNLGLNAVAVASIDRAGNASSKTVEIYRLTEPPALP